MAPPELHRREGNMLTKITQAILLAAVASSAANAHGPSGHSTHGHEAAYGRPGDPKSAAREVVVTMNEVDGKMLFEPARIEIKKGEQIRFRLENVGELDHEFLLGTPDEIEEHAETMKSMPEMKHDDPNAKQVAAKAKDDLVWHFTKAGEFDFACLIPGHREAGMTGKIVVK
jgi:uncharacterized cupredoxin-like copper-binding protein